MKDMENKGRQLCHDAIDMELETAKKMALDAGFKVRVRHLDGRFQVFTADIRYDRINLYVSGAGRVTQTEIG